MRLCLCGCNRPLKRGARFYASMQCEPEDVHRTKVGPNLDHCPRHAKQQKLPEVAR